MLRHTITEKDNKQRKKNKIVILSGGKIAGKKKSKRERKSARLRMSERIKK